jgi:queuine tRNA-ribosyltransferase
MRHLDKCGEMLGPMLATIHNLHYYQDLMRGLRGAIAAGRLEDFAAEFHQGLAAGE